jgi:hypothetical protein
MIAIGDSAYQAPSSESEAADPLVMRGCVVALAHYDEKTRTYHLQILEYVAGRQNQVVRGVWAAELHNQCDMIDTAVLLTSFMDEVRYGPQSGETQKQKREEGGSFAMTIDAFTDSHSIYSYMKALHLKFPADKGTFFHLAYMREALASGLLRSLTWLDTRDMVVDGLTKGMLDRSALHRLMAGVWQLQHACETHSDKSET